MQNSFGDKWAWERRPGKQNLWERALGGQSGPVGLPQPQLLWPNGGHWPLWSMGSGQRSQSKMLSWKLTDLYISRPTSVNITHIFNLRKYQNDIYSLLAGMNCPSSGLFLFNSVLSHHSGPLDFVLKPHITLRVSPWIPQLWVIVFPWIFLYLTHDQAALPKLLAKAVRSHPSEREAGLEAVQKSCRLSWWVPESKAHQPQVKNAPGRREAHHGPLPGSMPITGADHRVDGILCRILPRTLDFPATMKVWLPDNANTRRYTTSNFAAQIGKVGLWLWLIESCFTRKRGQMPTNQLWTRILVLCCFQPGPRLEARGVAERHTLASGRPEFKCRIYHLLTVVHWPIL